MIYAGVNGYLDNLPVNRIRGYEDGLLALLRSSHMPLLDAIRTSKDLDQDSAGTLKSTVETYTTSFA